MKRREKVKKEKKKKPSPKRETKEAVENKSR